MFLILTGKYIIKFLNATLISIVHGFGVRDEQTESVVHRYFGIILKAYRIFFGSE